MKSIKTEFYYRPRPSDLFILFSKRGWTGVFDAGTIAMSSVRRQRCFSGDQQVFQLTWNFWSFALRINNTRWMNCTKANILQPIVVSAKRTTLAVVYRFYRFFERYLMCCKLESLSNAHAHPWTRNDIRPKSCPPQVNQLPQPGPVGRRAGLAPITANRQVGKTDYARKWRFVSSEFGCAKPKNYTVNEL